MGHGSSLRQCHAHFLCFVLFGVLISRTNATKYVWKTGLWMECRHHNCGKGGTQFRSVFCGEQGEYNYNQADESKCSHLQKPKNMQKCFKVCDRHHKDLSWVASAYSDCALNPEYRVCSIKHGIQYRNVTCMWRTHGHIEDDRVCAEFKPKPEMEKRCDLKCEQDCVVSVWGGWKDCDTCLILNETRTRHLIIPPANGGKLCPEFTAMIPCDNCSQIYTYKIGPWDVCSPVDEYTRSTSNIHPLIGFQRRNIHCINSLGSIVAYKNCFKVLLSSTVELVNRQTCIIPQDCVVSNWTATIQLNTSCYHVDGTRQPGYIIRTRTITTVPLGLGRPCPNLFHYYEVQQTEEKPCPKTYWKMSSWSDCAAPPGGFTCTIGLQTRSAICVQQNEDGKEKPVAEKFCVMKRPLTSQTCHAECDLDCTMSQWTQWTECKVTDCELYLRRRRTDEGTGQRYRVRKVLTNARRDGKRCPHLSETQTCDPQPCYHWNITVHECTLLNPNTSPPCGLGIALRNLACVNKFGHRVASLKCEELEEQPSSREDCNIPCPQDCILSPWSPWSSCPNMCQEGRNSAPIQTRERSILAQAGRDGKGCPTNRYMSEVRPCLTTIECAVYVWQTEPWGTCQVNRPGAMCGPGTQSRDVSCYSIQGQLVSDQRCTLSVKPGTRQPCEVPCPVDCEVTEYSDWSPCSSSCWEAKQTVPVQTKVRYIIQYPKHGGSPCPNKLTEVKQCTNLTLCKASYWETTAWSRCILPLHKIPQCGQGLQARDVKCRSENGSIQEENICIQQLGFIPEFSKTCYKSCDEECVFEEWSFWSRCVNGCSGNRFRTRKLIIEELVPTNPKCRDRRMYPVDSFERCLCDKHQTITIGNWSECILEADSAYYKSPRSFPVGESGRENVTPQMLASVGVNAVCGQGQRYKVLACQNDKGEVEAAKQCSFKPYEEDVCLIPCPVDCVMSDWSHWTDCSTSCGTGTQMRYRHIKQMPSDGGRLCPSLDNAGKETQTRICTIDCQEHTWRLYKWSPCMPDRHDAQCGNGSQSRIVRCEVANPLGYTNNAADERFCMHLIKPHNRQLCYAPCVGQCVVSEWQSWSRCKQPCIDPNQLQSRTRVILRQPQVKHINNCPKLLEERFCIRGDNCIVYQWQMSDWTSCLINNGEDECGVGHKERHPICRDQTGRKVHHKLCEEAVGESSQLRVVSCQIQCDVDCLLTEWSLWSECSSTCGIGRRSRERDIVQQPQGNGRLCPNIFEQAKPCFEQGCYTWVVSEWSQCSYQIGVCGHGIQKRNVTCIANGGLPVNESNCAPDLNVIILQKEQPCTIPCPGECVITDWNEWNSCFIDCKHYDRSGYTRGVQSRSRAILAYAQLNNPACPEQLWESRPCEAENCYSLEWQVSGWSPKKMRHVWCERSDGLLVTGGCPNHSRPAETLMCNPPCNLPFSYCNDTNYCACEERYTSIFNSLNVLVDCKMENSTLAGPSPNPVTLPTDGPTNIWMYAVIAAGTLFVIFLAIACYTMSEFFHKGPRPRKKDEEKTIEGAENVDGMVEMETEFVSCNHMPSVTVLSGDVDRQSIVSADRTPPQSVRAHACNLHPISRYRMLMNVFKCCSVFTNRSDRDVEAPIRNGRKTNSLLHENKFDVVDSVHEPINGANDPYIYRLHERKCDCNELNMTKAEVDTHYETTVLPMKPRYSSTLNTQSAPLYAHVDKNNTVISSTKDMHVSPVLKPTRVVGGKMKLAHRANRTYKAFSRIDSDSDVGLNKKHADNIDSQGEINDASTINPAKDIVYLNREKSESDLDESHDIDQIDSNSLKDILQTYFDKMSGEESANDTTDGAKRNVRVAPNVEKDFPAGPENESFLDEDNVFEQEMAVLTSKPRRPSLIEAKSHSMDQPSGCNQMLTHIYDTTEDDNLSRTMSLRSHGSARSRLSNLSVSRGPSIRINPEECDINQNKMSKNRQNNQIPNKSQTLSANASKRNVNIGFIKFSSFDTETSTLPSTSVSCESLSSPRSLHSESPSEISMSDQCKAKSQDNASFKSAKIVAIDSLKYRHGKKSSNNLQAGIDEDFYDDDEKIGFDYKMPVMCVVEKEETNGLSGIEGQWEEMDCNGHENGGSKGTESTALLAPSHFSDKNSKKH